MSLSINYLLSSVSSRVPFFTAGTNFWCIDYMAIILQKSATTNYAPAHVCRLTFSPGGECTPKTCSAYHHVALVVPYRKRLSHTLSNNSMYPIFDIVIILWNLPPRNRLSQLTIFLRNVHPMLRQRCVDVQWTLSGHCPMHCQDIVQTLSRHCPVEIVHFYFKLR